MQEKNIVHDGWPWWSIAVVACVVMFVLIFIVSFFQIVGPTNLKDVMIAWGISVVVYAVILLMCDTGHELEGTIVAIVLSLVIFGFVGVLKLFGESKQHSNRVDQSEVQATQEQSGYHDKVITNQP